MESRSASSRGVRTGQRGVRRRVGLAAALAGTLLAGGLLAACGAVGGPGGSGRVSGEVKVGVSGSAEAGRPVEPRGPRAELTGMAARGAPSGTREAATGRGGLPAGDAPFVPGELIVAFEPSVAAASVSRLSAAGETLEAIGPLAVEGTVLYRTTADTLEEALALAAALEARPDVRYAHPNYLVFPALAPNDPGYGGQWHYGAIRLEEAWDITTGSADVVVAVVDSGILYSTSDPSRRHPDLAGRVLPGYDFISRESIARDGDGRDPDPYDTVPGGGYHGTHVAGTVGAATDNGLGVAGVDWRAKLLPLRVLGDGGGALSDLVDAVYWAVGGSVPGVPANPNPADVVNLSLGLESESCLPALHEALEYAASRAVVVAAAGNDAMPASRFTPANCPSVIAVGGTDPDGRRAWYSNYGSRVDVMAPGGDLSLSAADGVLSLGASAGGFGYVYMEGTSMAAPHVAGVAALMRALDPSLTTAEAAEVLRATARPLSDDECEGAGVPDRALYSFDCGSGLIDARRALEAVSSGGPPPWEPEEGVALAFSPPVLDLGAQRTSGSFTVTNVGDETAEWVFLAYDFAADNPGPVPAGVVSVDDDDAEGSLEPRESHVIDIHVDRSFLGADGFYVIQPVFVAGGREFLYEVRFAKVTAPSPTDLKGPMVVAAFVEDSTGELVVSGSQSSSGVITSYSFEVLSGRNLLSAWSDENGNGRVDEGDFLGYHPRWVYVPAGGHVTGVDVSVLPVAGGPVRDEVVEALEALGGSERR